MKSFAQELAPHTKRKQQTLARLVAMALRAAARRLCTGSHGDFGRVVKEMPAGGVEGRIRAHLAESPVVLYMKGLPSAPSCGFSWKTVQVLNAMGVEYRAHNVLVDGELREGIKKFSAWPTIPQVFVGGEFVGGCDIVESMARSGDLKDALVKAGALAQETAAPDPRSGGASE